MLIIPLKGKTVKKQRVCDYHKKHPGASWAGCTCSADITIENDDSLSDWADREMIGDDAFFLKDIGNK